MILHGDSISISIHESSKAPPDDAACIIVEEFIVLSGAIRAESDRCSCSGEGMDTRPVAIGHDDLGAIGIEEIGD